MEKAKKLDSKSRLTKSKWEWAVVTNPFPQVLKLITDYVTLMA